MERRVFLKGAASALCCGYATRAVSNIALGTGTLTTISDGSLPLPFALPKGVPDADLAALVERFSLTDGATMARPLNVTLWRANGRTILFDAGSGPSFVDSAGELYANLEAAGVSFDDITDVVFTHAHPDHIWGILDDFDEVPFPEATLWIGQAEFDYWTNPATLDGLDETVRFFAVGAQRRLDAIADGLRFLSDGDTFLPGVTARMTPGHTPGHMSFAVADSGDEAFILGDAVTNATLQFARPHWPAENDHDPEMAAATRRALLSELAASGSRVVGYHLPEGGMGRVETDGEGYRFVPGDA